MTSIRRRTGRASAIHVAGIARPDRSGPPMRSPQSSWQFGHLMRRRATHLRPQFRLSQDLPSRCWLSTFLVTHRHIHYHHRLGCRSEALVYERMLMERAVIKTRALTARFVPHCVTRVIGREGRLQGMVAAATVLHDDTNPWYSSGRRPVMPRNTSVSLGDHFAGFH